jgi:hypothetical protein
MSRLVFVVTLYALTVTFGQVLSAVRTPSGASTCTPFNQESISCPYIGTQVTTQALAWVNPDRVLQNGMFARSRLLLPGQFSGWIVVDNFQFTTQTDPKPTVGTSNIVGLEVELDLQSASGNNGRVQLPVGGVRLLANLGQQFRMYAPSVPKPTVAIPLQNTLTTQVVGGASDLWQSADGFSLASVLSPWSQAQFAVAVVAQGSGTGAQTDQMQLHAVRARLFFSDGTTTMLVPTTPGPTSGLPTTTTTTTTAVATGNNNGAAPGEQSNLGLIVGAVVGAVVLLALVALLVVFMVRRRQKSMGMADTSDVLLNYSEFADTTEFGVSTEVTDALPKNMIL